MGQMKIPAAPDIKTTVYGSLRGVDFSVDPSLVNKSRSPYAPNMISDDGGNPVKRPGWRVLHELTGRINGLFNADLGGREYIVAHAGTTLQILEKDTAKEIYTGIVDAQSCAFYMPSTGEESKSFDSTSEEYTYPKTVTLPKGNYNVKLTGGKGADYSESSGHYGATGAPGGTIIFELKLEQEAQIELKKITNGSEIFRTSFHLFVNGVLYAASGGGGDANRTSFSTDGGYTTGSAQGGLGGGPNGGDGQSGVACIAAKGAKGAIGGDGSGHTADSAYFGDGVKGDDYPISKGAPSRHDGIGGCGYAGGGGGGYASNKKETAYGNSTGGGGSSFLIENEAVVKVEDSQGTNAGPAYVKIKRKADDQQRLFILTGREFLVFDGETVKNVQEEAYVPTIIISRKPAGGGTIFEAVNLMQMKRTESFLGDSSAKDYQLTATNIDETPVTVKIANGQGEYDEMAEGSGFTVNRVTGKVTFTAVHAPVVSGQDNVLITYGKTVPGYLNKIRKCTICTTYGVGGSNRVFLSGNPEFKAYDFWSDIFRPSYFPDLNYAVVGINNTAIMGYQKLGEYLSIIKEDNQQDTTIFLRTGSLDNNGNALFSVKPGIAGIGALSKYCFVNLGDEPLFLSRMGVYATTSTLLSYERVAKNRSYFIDKKLRAETGLENAAACEWNGYYLLSINGNVYVLDGRHKSADKSGNTDFVYECYHWTDVPARCWLSVGGELYFGTEYGRICKFNTDNLPNAKMTIYSDNGKLGEDGRITGGKAIDSAWFTPNDDDGAVHLFKTLQKKGSLVTISPYDRSSAEVCFVVDGNPEEIIKKENMDIFDWEDVDFDRFTFNSNTSPQEIYFQKKKKKYKRLQIGIRNRQINEGCGIHQIVKSFTIGNYSKNRGD